MEQYINNFITYLKDVKHAASNTTLAYQGDLKKLEFYLYNHNIFKVTNISGTILNSYVLSLEKGGLSPASVSRSIASAKSFILYLVKQGVIMGDPSDQIKAPKVIRKIPNIIDTKSIELLLQQPNTTTKKGIRDKAMLELLYATGIKVTELISIKLSNINIVGRYLICQDKNERIIPFGAMAKYALLKYLDIREKEFNKRNSSYLFMNASGNQLSRQGLWKILKNYATDAGLKDINPNTIRNSFAAHLLNNGADLASVQELLGHTDNASTQLYLSHNNKNNREVYYNTHPRT